MIVDIKLDIFPNPTHVFFTMTFELFGNRVYEAIIRPVYLTSFFKVINLALLWQLQSCENQTRTIDF